MKEHPIIFSTPMIKAILEGRKTQTRRVLATRGGKFKGQQPLEILPMLKPNEWVGLMEREPNHGIVFKCRYGQVGDRLWVRETWTDLWSCNIDLGDVIYKATPPNAYFTVERWKPSIFMPRAYSRITLEITDEGAERVQDISHDDVIAEGLSNAVSNDLFFPKLWDSINGKKHPWSSNPWVWVISFKVT